VLYFELPATIILAKCKHVVLKCVQLLIDLLFHHEDVRYKVYFSRQIKSLKTISNRYCQVSVALYKIIRRNQDGCFFLVVKVYFSIIFGVCYFFYYNKKIVIKKCIL